MPFPKTKTQKKPEEQQKALSGLQIKKQGNVPLAMCEFFEGFEVLQTQGIQSQEFIFGIYFSNQFCGHIYFGEKWTQQQVSQICQDIMPPNWNDIEDYVDRKSEKVWYYKMHPDQYAWIYERVIKKIS